MDLNEYQARALHSAIYPDQGANLIYPGLKIAGEAGEIAEKIGKLVRDKGYKQGQPYHTISNDELLSLAKEIGDVLWYIAALAEEIGYTLESIGQINLTKLNDRRARGTLGGSGDDR